MLAAAAIARSGAMRAIQLLIKLQMDCFAEPVIGRTFLCDPVARNDGLNPI
jgi:hypothetical protein